MDLILLSGESIKNRVWIEEVRNSLQDLFDESRILYYKHWELETPTIDLDLENSRLPDLTRGLDEYVIFAKSIGSVLTLRGIYEKVLAPQKCFFVGPAFLVGENFIPDFPKLAKKFAVPSFIITKTLDPVAPAEKIRALLQKYDFQNYTFVEIPGDNHHYEDLTKIRTLVSELSGKS